MAMDLFLVIMPDFNWPFVPVLAVILNFGFIISPLGP